ncbi:PHP domain-containing protein [Clostridium thermarum]|uniref:PHP domain-containing protein n=1 Tax=Clostridium thermarum TaxID=1716543 RepID=UPI0013D71D0F|nr:PHP domain-containing protein [Clostridium thermarum]
MIYSDLHIHSSYSDGSLTPKEIIDISKSKGINCISITDHDSILSQYELSKISEEITIVPGLELSSEYNGHEIHFLGYFIDVFNTELISVLNDIHKERVERVYTIIGRLRKLGINISECDIKLDSFVSMGRPHIAKLLLDKGYVKSLREAFHLYLAKGRPAYIERYKLNYKEALKLIKNSGGISVLAHPGELYKGIDPEKLIRDLKIYGLCGIEVFHPSHDSKDINNFYNLSKKYKLVICGGTDYHGSNTKSDINIGAIGLDLNLTTKFFNYYNKYNGGQVK